MIVGPGAERHAQANDEGQRDQTVNSTPISHAGHDHLIQMEGVIR